MRAKETDVLDVGCRTLAVAMGKHHGTIARLLPECIINHPNFVELVKGEHEFVIHSNDDDKQHIRLALIPIHVAASASLSSRPLHKATVAE